MHLRSITLKGFKSFPDRTQLDFGPGVSRRRRAERLGQVEHHRCGAVGDGRAVAARRARPVDARRHLRRRPRVQARSAAEVEIVIDNADGGVDVPLGEISILRRLDRSGEGEYRLNGARCRLVDILEVLSDTGLGKEMHSVVSQGRVESIVTSKPRDRRLLIEEAAGLGKHRKRRRRAQRKLERTQDNLERALDVEREARLRLRPLKRQAEAAELHARLERQTLEARWELVRDVARARRAQLSAADDLATAARSAREAAQTALHAVAARRLAAERAMAQRTEQREAFAQRVYRARSAGERVELRLERVRSTAQDLRERAERRALELTALSALAASDDEPAQEGGGERVVRLEAELQQLAADHAVQLERELVTLRAGARAGRGRSPGGPRGGRRRPRTARVRDRRDGGRPRPRAARAIGRWRPRAARRRGSAPSSPLPTSSCARAPPLPVSATWPACARLPTRWTSRRATSAPSPRRSVASCAPRSSSTYARAASCSAPPAPTADVC